ncbi:ANTAR domain-containing protein [Promicromonospora sukumoe]|uniref:ANTAR domain-containing protein n=1 Tax=Promicromonospora sukumoe TaxID=88382 RepID=UPI00366260CE
MKWLSVPYGTEYLMMPAHRQSWTLVGPAEPASPVLSTGPPPPTTLPTISPAPPVHVSEPDLAVHDAVVVRRPPDETVPTSLVGQVMIERAKSVVVVSRRVDEATATQMLVDAADSAGIPVRAVADQIVTALQNEGSKAVLTQDVLEHAVEATEPAPPREVPGADITPSTARAPS